MSSYAATTAAMYARAATHTDGASLRALLGQTASAQLLAVLDSAALLFPAARLATVQQASAPLPWLVWRLGPVGGDADQLRDLHASWWIYVAPTNEALLQQISDAVIALYEGANRFAVPSARTRITHIGQPAPDGATNQRLARELRVTASRR